MSKVETALVTYQAARAEMLERIKLRDHLLVVYLAGVGTVFGIALQDPPRWPVTLAIPFVGFGVALLATQHSAFIGHLGDFCNEVMNSLAAADRAPHWDGSKAHRHGLEENPHAQRAFAHALLLAGPSAVALTLNAALAHAPNGGFIVWWSGTYCCAAAALSVRNDYASRRAQVLKRSRGADEPPVGAVSTHARGGADVNYPETGMREDPIAAGGA